MEQQALKGLGKSGHAGKSIQKSSWAYHNGLSCFFKLLQRSEAGGSCQDDARGVRNHHRPLFRFHVQAIDCPQNTVEGGHHRLDEIAFVAVEIGDDLHDV